MKSTPNHLPENGFVRLVQIIGQKEKEADEDKGRKAKAAITPLIPIGRTTFLNGVKSGKFPKPVKLSERTNAWRVEDIINLINSMGAE